MSTIKFQAVSWHSYDDEEDKEYVIDIFGRTDDNKSICCRTKFEPFFFVEVPEWWNKADLSKFKDNLMISKRLKDQLLDLSFVHKKRFYGFTNDNYFKFIVLRFQSNEAFKNTFYSLKRKNMKIYEANIDPTIRFVHMRNLETTGWIEFDTKDAYKEYNTSCELEYQLKHFNCIRKCDNETIGKIKTASFDIETYSPDRSFPDANSKTNDCPIIQIATTLEYYGDDKPFKKHLVNLGTCDDIEDTELIRCETESELLVKWLQFIKHIDPDILTGYNIWKFDLDYIYKRCKKHNIFMNISRYRNYISKCYSARFSSSAYGTNEYFMIESFGRTQIDLLELLKRDYKLEKYSLNAVSQHFLKDEKVDLDAKTMFTKFEGNSADRKEIGIYCVKDTILPLDLIRKLNKIPNLIEMAKVTYVPLSYLLEKGQQIKVFSQITRQTRLDDMLVITPNFSKSNESFEGATVFDAQCGAYMDKVVTGLDFASLYPTIMRAHNLCYNSIVLEKEFENVPGIEYTEVLFPDKMVKFAQNTQGILPRILENLALSRKKAKKEMAIAVSEGNKFKESIYNGKQLAFKVSMNSIYGFCAAFMLPCKDISASVTTIGRQMIEKTKNYVEENYEGAKVIYGDTDSVMVIFDTTKEPDIQSKIKKSFELGIEAADKITKIFKKPIELEMEKCYSPYLLFAKKRYAGKMYTNPDKPDYIDVKGLELVRRDNPGFVKDISKQVLDTIMYEYDVEAATKLVKDFAKSLLDNKIDISKMTVSKSLRADYVNNNQPHIVVANKIKQRNPGSEPKTGDRVPYVFVKDATKGLQCFKAEDPTFVKDNGIEIDTLYYLEHCLINPMCTIFEVFLKHPKQILFDDIILKHNHKKSTKSIIYYL